MPLYKLMDLPELLDNVEPVELREALAARIEAEVREAEQRVEDELS